MGCIRCYILPQFSSTHCWLLVWVVLMTPSEDRIQQQCVMWYTNKYCLTSHNPRNIIYHVANENQHKHINLGVLGGVADIVVIHNGEHVYIEFKDHKGQLRRSLLGGCVEAVG